VGRNQVMVSYHKLSTENDQAKVSLGPVMKRIGKCAIIILPSLMLSSVIMAVDIS